MLGMAFLPPLLAIAFLLAGAIAAKPRKAFFFIVASPKERESPGTLPGVIGVTRAIQRPP